MLVIEDYRPLRESLAKGLRDLGYAVDATGEGHEGLWYIENHPYDVAIIDIMVPGMSGLEVLRRARAAKRDVRVLLLTARDGVADRVAGLDLGADDYLAKPFAFDELCARIRALVRRHYERTDPVIRIADLEIDTQTRSARRGGQPITFSAREFMLLEYLANRAGQVVTRAELYDHVYDADEDRGSNVLEVFISRLRRKIDDGHAQKLIHTRRGHGYMLGEES